MGCGTPGYRNVYVIAVRNLVVRQGALALENITLEVPTGASAVLMGKTGTGKTTLLEAICGLRPTESGFIQLMGQDVHHDGS